jgi:hypothetical protein
MLSHTFVQLVFSSNNPWVGMKSSLQHQQHSCTAIKLLPMELLSRALMLPHCSLSIYYTLCNHSHNPAFVHSIWAWNTWVTGLLTVISALGVIAEIFLLSNPFFRYTVQWRGSGQCWCQCGSQDGSSDFWSVGTKVGATPLVRCCATATQQRSQLW